MHKGFEVNVTMAQRGCADADARNSKEIPKQMSKKRTGWGREKVGQEQFQLHVKLQSSMLPLAPERQQENSPLCQRDALAFVPR